MYCWNCNEEVKTLDGYVQHPERYPDEEGSTIVHVIYCSQCKAILQPRELICFACKRKSRTFITDIMFHFGATQIPLCEQCRKEVGGERD